MTYDKQILHILTVAGERGISVQAIAKHVYNMNRTFFVQPDLEEIRSYVQHYRLNTTGSADALQMMLQFREEQQGKEEEKPQQDLSLDLFD